MISLDEHIVSFSQASKVIPRRRAGKPAHISCFYRWGSVGCRGVVLETIQIGGTRCTSLEALERFFARLSALSSRDDPKSAPLTRLQAAEAEFKQRPQ